MISIALCMILTVALLLSLSGCSGQNPETSENSDPNSVETVSDDKPHPATENLSDEKTETPNPDLIEEGQYLFFKDDPIITDKGNYYEIENVCIAQGGEFRFERSMFEGKEIGDLLHLPNGDFTLDNISEVGELIQFDVSNDHFFHYFVLDGDTIYAVGVGEHLVLESKYVGPIRFLKKCHYETQEDLEHDPVKTNFQKHIESTKSPWEYGAFLSVDALDFENNILAVSDVVLP